MSTIQWRRLRSHWKVTTWLRMLVFGMPSLLIWMIQRYTNSLQQLITWWFNPCWIWHILWIWCFRVPSFRRALKLHHTSKERKHKRFASVSIFRVISHQKKRRKWVLLFCGTVDTTRQQMGRWIVLLFSTNIQITSSVDIKEVLYIDRRHLLPAFWFD